MEKEALKDACGVRIGVMSSPTLYRPDLEGLPWSTTSWQAPVWDPDSAAAIFPAFSSL